VVEFLSPGTEAEDLGRFCDASSRVPSPDVEPAAEVETEVTEVTVEATREKPPGKFAVYEDYLRVPHYIVYNRYSQRLRYFKLNGGQYEEQALNSTNPLIWLADLEIGLGIWQGEFEDVTAGWLRWCSGQGEWLLTDTEQAEAQLLQAARNLLATGMEVEQVAQMLGLPLANVTALCSIG